MANADTPFGLKLVGHTYSASPFNARTSLAYVAAGYETDIFVGDPVIKVAAGSNTARVSGLIGVGNPDIGTIPNVEAATVGDGNSISGVCVGIVATNRDSAVYAPADTESVIRVCWDPFALYEIQADGAVPAASIGLNAVLIGTHSGNTRTGLSGMELDTTSDAPAVDASNQLTILGIVDRPDNTPNLVHNKVLVRLNNHTDVTLDKVGI